MAGTAENVQRTVVVVVNDGQISRKYRALMVTGGMTEAPGGTRANVEGTVELTGAVVVVAAAAVATAADKLTGIVGAN